jgi:hypothetical protein
VFPELVVTVIWLAVPKSWKVDVVKPLIVGLLPPEPVIVIIFGEDVETVTVPAPTKEVVEFERPSIAVMPEATAAGTHVVPL